MEALQIFTVALLAVGFIHLVFSAVEVCERLFFKKRSNCIAMKSNVKNISRSGWYVFFDPADLYGKQAEKKSNKQPRSQNSPSIMRRSNPRKSAQW